MTFSRRDLMLGGAGLAAMSPFLGQPAFAQGAAEPKYTPEKGAELRVLRWSPFVPSEEAAFIANAKKFTDETGVAVRIDKESWEDIRPKAAVAANVGSGPDIVLVWFDDPFQYPDKLVDLTDLAGYLGGKYGGWYPALAEYAKRGDRFIALPLATISNAVLYRESWLKEAGFSSVPDKTDGFLELCKALKAKGHPAGFTLGHGVGDGNNFCHWLLWSHGGKLVDEQNKVAINSPETVAALRYVRQLYPTFIAGTESWLDVNNNRAYLAGEIGMTANGISLYYSAKNDPKLADMAADTKSTNFPVGPVGKPVELYQVTSTVLFKHTKYPEAAKAFLKFMFEKAQYDAWLTASTAYCCQSLQAFKDNPIWTANPVHKPYANASANLRSNGYSGQLGPASAATMADYVVVDMFAEAATGARTPEEAAKRAEQRATRFYRNA